MVNACARKATIKSAREAVPRGVFHSRPVETPAARTGSSHSTATCFRRNGPRGPEVFHNCGEVPEAYRVAVAAAGRGGYHTTIRTGAFATGVYPFQFPYIFPRVALMREAKLRDNKGRNMSESVLADDLHIKGEVITNGDVELKGTVDGEIRCRTLLVAEDARVMGTASAEKVVIRGAVEGTISGNRVTLTSSAKVRGEVLCKALSVDEEAYFDGRSQRVDDPMQDTRKRIEAVSRENETRPPVTVKPQAAQPEAPQPQAAQPAPASTSAKGGAPKSEKNGGGPAQPIASGASH